jgi:DNA-binding IclR family transcriptional regulator
METEARRRIIEILKDHPEGLTLLDIARIIGMNRVTVSKYVYGLVSEGIIQLRTIGPAKLCCLKTIYA